MLEEFLYKHDIDLVLLQEVTNFKITTIRRYTSYINMGTDDRGPLHLQRIATYLPLYNAYIRDEEYQHISMELG